MARQARPHSDAVLCRIKGVRFGRHAPIHLASIICAPLQRTDEQMREGEPSDVEGETLRLTRPNALHNGGVVGRHVQCERRGGLRRPRQRTIAHNRQRVRAGTSSAPSFDGKPPSPIDLLPQLLRSRGDDDGQNGGSRKSPDRRGPGGMELYSPLPTDGRGRRDRGDGQHSDRQEQKSLPWRVNDDHLAGQAPLSPLHGLFPEKAVGSLLRRSTQRQRPFSEPSRKTN